MIGVDSIAAIQGMALALPGRMRAGCGCRDQPLPARFLCDERRIDYDTTKGRITMTNLELHGMVAMRDYERLRAKHLREAGWFSALATTQTSRPATTRRARFSWPNVVNWFSATRPTRTVAQSHGNA